ncbi:MAG: UvrD-helicase domain-containing protein [Solobacterium sp.]|nr:UvrD-helicase domain-containing protein [Solobacterium sp.]
MPLDTEQNRAVNAVGRNILVSASAGAGKTGVLISRLIKRCVNDRIPLERILAMTFTKAAASEMKKRLARELNTLYADAADPEEKQWLRKQLIALAAADITTIDSYCLKIIQKYGNIIGIDPAAAANTLEGGQTQLLLRQAFTDALKIRYELEPEETLRMLIVFSPRSEDYEKLFASVTKINNAAQASVDPDAWYAAARASSAPAGSLRMLDQDVLSSFFGSLMIRTERLLSLLDKMEQHALDDPKIKPDALREKRNCLLNCINALRSESYSSYCIAFEGLASCKTPPSTKNEPYTDARKALTDGIKKLAAVMYSEKTLLADMKDTDVICRSLVDLSHLTWDLFMQEKKKRSVVDFSDMERFALDILKKNSCAAAELIRSALDEIMVDEFQDTSELQNEIIELISNGRNVFRVGDVKQSIYRFRQAKPELMLSLMKDADTEQITLRHNYRSQESIVRYSNMLFGTLMNANGCSGSYKEDDMVSIGRPEQAEGPVPVVFAGIDTGDETEEETYGVKEKKAMYIASEIIRQKTADPRLKWNSFAVLVRSHADKGILRQVFEKYGIQFEIDAREGFYRSDLCMCIRNIVRWMQDKNDGLALAGTLKHYYGFSDEQMAVLKTGYPSLLKAVESECGYITEECGELRRLARDEDVPAFLRAAARLHDFYDTLPSSQQANFDFLYEKVNSAGITNFTEFCDVLAAGQDDRSSEAVSRGKDDDLVTVTTIHQSKGLQYPIVFLWSSSKNMFNDAADPVVISKDRIGLKHIDPEYRSVRTTVYRMAAEYNANKEDLEEFIRLLYVAVTRAEKRLFIVDAMADITKRDISLAVLSERKGMTSLILSAMEENPLFAVRSAEIDEPFLEESSAVYADSLPSLKAAPQLLRPAITPSETEVTFLPDLEPRSHRYGRQYGTVMHEAIESLPDTHWTQKDMESLDLSQADKEKLLLFADSELYEKCLTMTIRKEYPFFADDGKNRITGQIDFLAVSDSECVIIDFKTDSAPAAEIIRRYSAQLNTYRHVVRMMYPQKKISVYAWSFHNDTEILIPETDR